MRSAIYHPKAPSEARQFFQYYQSVSPSLAEEFWNELLEVVEIAREFPERHHFDSTGLRRSNLKRFPVHILFKTFPTHIRITTIRHDRQNPSHGTNRI